MFKIFSRYCWTANPGWPDGHEPAAKPMDKCPTLHECETRDEAVDYCEDRNQVWRKHADKIRSGTATDLNKKVYYGSPRFEFTEI